MTRGPKPQTKRHCRKCGDTDPANFYRGKHAKCKKCRAIQSRESWRSRQIAAGHVPRTYANHKYDGTAHERELAARFGLTVQQYREAAQ